MSLNSKLFLSCSASVLFFAITLTGCGGGGEKKRASNSEQVSNSKPAASTPGSPNTGAENAKNSVASSDSTNATQVAQQRPASNELKGVWYGESVYDVDAFSAKLSQVNEEEAIKLQQIVSTFGTIVMAAEFRPDSVVELDMMITTPDGQQLRDRSVGTWAILEKTDSYLKVETTEYKDETQEPTKKVYVYQFLDDDRFQFVPDSVSPDMLGMSPRIVFQRVDQPLDDAAVAEQPTDTVNR